MKEYVKLPTTITDRLLFLFTGLIKKQYIISKSVEPKEYTPSVLKNNDTPKTSVVKDTKRVVIPFFELDNSKAKSNL